MFRADDTIAAIATPLGRSGLGVIRVSGPSALTIGAALAGGRRPLEPRHATLAWIDCPGGVRDQSIITAFPAPHSYTGQDSVEVSTHGSPVVLRGVLDHVLSLGARLAEPGEFTLRAFLAGKIDLVQAEAVADLIDAVTPLQARVASDQLDGTLTSALGAVESHLFDLIVKLEASLDFPDEGYHFIEAGAARATLADVRGRIAALVNRAQDGRLIREGVRLAIVGTPNAGKSSLFNALLDADRAIVTPVAGTTRDVLSERANLGGLSVALFDTAGQRESEDPIEREGIARARSAAAAADVVVLVLDRSRVLTADDHALLASAGAAGAIVVMNKIDLPAAWPLNAIAGDALAVSAATREGLDALIGAIVRTAGAALAPRDEPLVSNVRHLTLLTTAAAALARADAALAPPLAVPEEFVLADLQEAAEALQEVTGRRTSEDVLLAIFERFCIGK